jgi:hypothetical protein
MVVYAAPPHLDGEQFTILLPKMVATRHLTLLNFPDATISWIGPDEDGRLSCHYNAGTSLEYRIVLTPHKDWIDAEISLTNRSDLVWEEAWFFNFLAPQGALSFQDPSGSRLYLEIDHTPVSIERTLKDGNEKKMILFLPADSDVEKSARAIRQLNKTSPVRTTSRWMFGLNAAEDAWFGMATNQAAFLFHNRELSSLHVAASFGDIAPDETKTALLRFWFADGNKSEAIQRITRELPELKHPE